MVDATLGRLFLNRVSTRRFKGIAREVYRKEISPQTVSSTLSSLEEELSQFKAKPIEDTVEFLFLDDISQKVREINIEKKFMLCAFGIYRKTEVQEERKKGLLAFQLTDVEDEASWKGFLADFKGRDLLGKHLKLIIKDRNRLF